MDRRYLYMMVSWIVFTTIAIGQANNRLTNLMPLPASISFSGEDFRLDNRFSIAVHGPDSSRVPESATRFLRRLSGRTGLFIGQGIVTMADRADTAGLKIRWDDVAPLVLGMDESYALKITNMGIQLDAQTDIGVIRGLETLLGLIDADQRGYFLPGVEIVDKPRFPWRGLLIDACRHFMPVEVIKRNLDGMAAVKLNVLHWHLTEDQGFRVESKRYPKLHELGSDGLYYTQAQIRAIVAYADARGIRVMPEFDIPGHASSWLTAYPELGTEPGPYELARKWGVFDPTMDPTKESTYEFLDAFIGEMVELFPDKYLHIGGDENNGRHWNDAAHVQDFKAANDLPDNHALQGHFNLRVLKILTKYERQLVGWDEIYHPSMPTNIVIQSWRGKQALVDAANKGYQSILSSGYYIDLIQSTEQHYLNDPIPPGTEISPEARLNILGGEATMWSEYISWETIDSRIWPRTAAIAERFWSPVEVRDVPDMYRRLDAVSLQLEEHGLTHEKNYDMFLRRLAGGHDDAALRVLIDVIEPLKGYQRGRYRTYTQFTPLTRVADAARPDAAVARNFRQSVAAYLAIDHPVKPFSFVKRNASAEVRSLIEMLQLWSYNHARLSVLIKLSPILKEIESLSLDLAIMGDIGLEAINIIERGKVAPVTWVAAQQSVFEGAKKQRGQTELMIVDAIANLVATAGNSAR